MDQILNTTRMKRITRSSSFEWYKSGGDILIFLGIWLSASLFIGQDRLIVKWGFLYWLAVMPAMFFPLFRAKQVFYNLLFGVARPIALFGLASAIWLAARQDFAAIAPLFLLVWVIGWASRDEVKINIRDLFILTCIFYVAALIVYSVQYYIINQYPESYSWMRTLPSETLAASSMDIEAARPLLPPQDRLGMDFNPWGVFPGQTIVAFSEHWRISATPKIATSALFSFLILLISTQYILSSKFSRFIALAASYFAFLSFVRAVIAAGMLFVTTLSMMLLSSRSLVIRVVIATLTTAGIILTVWVAPTILYYLQDYEIVSRFFLRGQSNLTVSDISRQLYRTWLWTQHFNLFLDSDYLMGLGSDISKTASTNILNANQIRSDSDSFLTRLLATYGLPFFGLVAFLALRSYAFAQSNEIWSVTMVSTLVWMMMTWGSSFHPSNGIFVLAFLIIGRGQSAFSLKKLQ